MLKATLRRLLTTLMVLSSLTTAWMVWSLAQHPTLSDALERRADEVEAAIETAMARHVTQEVVEARLRDRLAETPRNWVVIDSLIEVAEEQSITLPAHLLENVEEHRSVDRSSTRLAATCAACAWDAANCDLSGILFCRVGDLTPLGDVVGIARESARYASGNQVDKIDLTLSAVGLMAIAATPVTGGASMAAKIGAAIAKTARRMGKLSGQFTDMIVRTAQGIPWAKVAKARTPEGLRQALGTGDAIAFRRAMTHIGSIHEQIGLAGGLHVMSHIDSAGDARHLARATHALGSNKVIGRLELLGKNRLVRASMRYSNEVWMLVSAIGGILIAIVGLFWSALSSIFMRTARRALRERRS